MRSDGTEAGRHVVALPRTGDGIRNFALRLRKQLVVVDTGRRRERVVIDFLVQADLGEPDLFNRLALGIDELGLQREPGLDIKPDTVPEAICPDVDGAAPDGAELATPIDVEAGTLLGLVGSSGNSSINSVVKL